MHKFSIKAIANINKEVPIIEITNKEFISNFNKNCTNNFKKLIRLTNEIYVGVSLKNQLVENGNTESISNKFKDIAAEQFNLDINKISSNENISIANKEITRILTEKYKELKSVIDNIKTYINDKSTFAKYARILNKCVNTITDKVENTGFINQDKESVFLSSSLTMYPINVMQDIVNATNKVFPAIYHTSYEYLTNHIDFSNLFKDIKSDIGSMGCICELDTNTNKLYLKNVKLSNNKTLSEEGWSSYKELLSIGKSMSEGFLSSISFVDYFTRNVNNKLTEYNDKVNKIIKNKEELTGLVDECSTMFNSIALINSILKTSANVCEHWIEAANLI